MSSYNKYVQYATVVLIDMLIENDVTFLKTCIIWSVILKNLNLILEIFNSRHELEKSGPDPSPSFQILRPAGPNPRLEPDRSGPSPSSQILEPGPETRARFWGPGPNSKSPAPDKHCDF